MNDRLEEVLTQLTPRGAPPELREDTLAATRDTLSVRPPRRWDLWCGLAVTASLLLGIGLNYWVIWADEMRFAELHQTESLPKHVAEAADSIESITDPETGQWVREQWRIAQAGCQRSRDEALEHIRDHYQSIVDELALARKEPSHVEIDQVDRDRSGRTDGDTTHFLRHPRLHHEFTA